MFNLTAAAAKYSMQYSRGALTVFQGPDSGKHGLKQENMA